jgi:hypothetical protein
MKMGKRNGKRKKKRNSQLAGPGGDFGPAERRRVLARGRWPSRPTRSGDGTADAVGAGPCARERKGETTSGGRRAVRGGGEPIAGDPDGGSSPVVRF